MVRLSAEVVKVVKLRMIFLEEQGEVMNINAWLDQVTDLSDQGDYLLMVLKDTT